MALQGNVTNVDTDLLCFEINNKYKVHCGIAIVNGQTKHIPAGGSFVKIKFSHKNGLDYIVCPASEISGDNVDTRVYVNVTDNLFFKFVKKYNLGSEDLFLFSYNLNVLRKVFHNFKYAKLIEIVINIFKQVKLINKFSLTHSCDNKVFDEFYLNTVSSCRYVNILSDKYVNFPYWSFGVHTNLTNRYLFGKLVVDCDYGFLVLKNSIYQIVCQIFKTEKKLHSIVNKYVLIKDYKIITEIYGKKNIPNIECILTNFDDIYVICNVDVEVDKQKKEEGLFFDRKPNDMDRTSKVMFSLIRKSMPYMSSEQVVEIYLQVKINDTEMAYLILPSQYITIAVFFKEGQNYSFFYNGSLKEKPNNELSRLSCQYKTYAVTSKNGGYFTKAADEPSNNHIEEILTVDKCKTTICSEKQLLSFQGKLERRMFSDALPSRTKNHTTKYGFGMPGKKTHNLVFASEPTEENVLLDCYLNNWENILMPLCLIPEMRIEVKNVTKKKKYCKSTPFTSFEILSYEPDIEFESANLHYDGDTLDWGGNFYLGLGNLLPLDVLVWGRVLIEQIYSVALQTICKVCKNIVENINQCNKCKSSETELDMSMIILVKDSYGMVKVKVDNPQFLKILLKLSCSQYTVLYKELNDIIQYKYSLVNNYFETTCPHSKALTRFFSSINTLASVFVNLQCRKISDDNNRKILLCVDFQGSEF